MKQGTSSLAAWPALAFAALLALALMNPVRGHAQDGLSDAKSMVNDAVYAIAAHGWPDALAAVPPETWARLDEDLYVFVVNTRGVIVFHPNRRAIGVNVSGAVDNSGYAYMQDLMRQLDSEGSEGLVEYYWPRPSDGELRLKRTYARRIGNLMVACGVYVEDI